MLPTLLKRKNQFIEFIELPITDTPWFLKDKILPSLDGWRAIAILLVVLSHLRISAPSVFDIYRRIAAYLFFGGLGVQIFFVLSGFLITTLLIREKQRNGKINIKAFFIRRSLRIFPVLYLYLSILFIINYYLNLKLNICYFLGPALYIQNFAPFGSVWLIGHTWSLGVEEQFYLIWPFLFLKLKRSIYVVTIILLIIPIITVLSYSNNELNTILLVPFLKPASSIFYGALMSIFVYKLHHRIDFKQILYKRFVFLAVLITYFAEYYTSQGKFSKLLLPFGDTLTNISICYVILYSLIQRNSILFKVLNSKIAVELGIISYSLYIWQQLFILPIGTSKYLEQFSFFPINVILALLIALLSYHGFEKPFLKMKAKFSL